MLVHSLSCCRVVPPAGLCITSTNIAISICFTLAFQAAPVAIRQEPLGVDGLHVVEGTLLATTNQNYQQEQIIQGSINRLRRRGGGAVGY